MADLDQADIKKVVREACIAIRATPVLCGSAFKNKGVQPLLDAVFDYLPAPTDIKKILAFRADSSEEEFFIEPDTKEPLSLLAFKIATDPFVGQLVFARIYSGVLNQGQAILNPRENKKERVSKIMRMQADKREELKRS